MGLDQYLIVRRHIGGYRHSRPEDREWYRRIVKELDLEGIASHEAPAAEVSVCVGYWRKAHGIHRWFVDNIQSGEDDCGTYYLSEEKAKDLLLLCQTALLEHQKSDEEGISFALSEFPNEVINGWFWEDIKSTISILTLALQIDQGKNGLYYQSSW